MNHYEVRWSIEISADNPTQAARDVLAIMRDPTSIATVFEVIDGGGNSTIVDLDGADEKWYNQVVENLDTSGGGG